MTPTFLDTSFLLALLLKTDQHHQRAVRWKRRLRGPFLTTEYVLIEVLDCCAAPGTRHACARSVKLVSEANDVTIVGASRALMMKGLALYEQRADKGWGATDCISFCVMSEHRMTDALSSDHHFQQAGFDALLRRDPPEEAT